MSQHVPGEQISLGILFDRVTQPRWVKQSLSNLKGLTCVRLSAQIRADRATRESGHSTPARVPLYDLYNILDRRVFIGQGKSLLDEVSIDGLLGDLDAMSMEEFIARGREMDLDVIIDFSSDFRGRRLHDLTKFGVWFHLACDAERGDMGPPGLWQVLKAKSIVGAALIASEPADGTMGICYRSNSSTHRWSVNRTNQAVYSKLATFAARKIDEVSRSGHLSSDRLDARVDAILQSQDAPPSAASIIRPILSLIGRYGVEKARNLHEVDCWSLLYRLIDKDDRLSADLSSYKVLKPPAGGLYADPFPVYRNGRHHIFFEECPIGVSQGVISVVEVAENGSCSPAETVLERPYHLSYPFLIEHQDDLYMIPETSGNNCVEIYRCVEWPGRWELVHVLLENTPGVDATVQEIDGLYWMFVSVPLSEGITNSDEVSLYHAKSPLGPWQPHAINPVKSDVKSSRGAGALFFRDGHWYRPAQDCSVRYGYGITLNRIIELSTTTYREERAATILPTWPADSLGVHTINHCQGLSVADALLRVPRKAAGMDGWYGAMVRRAFDAVSSVSSARN